MVESLDLSTVLAEHRKWLRGEGGQRANLRGADLSDADLRYAETAKVIATTSLGGSSAAQARKAASMR